MGTLVLLTAFLLAASANPIVNSPEDTVDEASSKDPGDVLSTDDETQMPPVDNTANNADEPHSPINEVPYSTENPGDTNNGDAANGDGHYRDGANEDADNGHSNSGYEDNRDAHNEDGLTSDSTTPTTMPTEDNATNSSDEAATWTNDTASDTSTKPSVSNSEIELHKGDDSDCNFTDGANHTYQKCQFLCETDEMQVALPNASCYLNQTKTKFSSLGVRNRMEPIETGICQDGECIPRPPETSTSISTSEPSSSSFPTAETSTSPSETQTSTSASTTAATANNSQDITTSKHIIMD